jgi:hypothetical protein
MRAALRELLGKPEPLFALGYMLFPLLGLICAALGLWMVVTGAVVAGIIMLLAVTQAFVLGALWAIGKRRRLLASENPGS